MVLRSHESVQIYEKIIIVHEMRVKNVHKQNPLTAVRGSYYMKINDMLTKWIIDADSGDMTPLHSYYSQDYRFELCVQTVQNLLIR